MLVYSGEGGFVNNLINKLPVEIHLPGGFQFCGPGTKLEKRLKRGDPGINPLDKACKVHDIAYSKFKNLEDRHKADEDLEQAAWNRFNSKDVSLGEKSAAWFVTTVMKAKRKMGMGMRGSRRRRKFSNKIKNANKPKKGAFVKRKIGMGTKGNRRKFSNKIKNVSKPKKGAAAAAKRKMGIGMMSNKRFFNEIKNAIKTTKKGDGSFNSIIKHALTAAKRIVKNVGGTKKIKLPRVISIPKVGGIIPFLVPIFAGLSALGALAGGSAQIANAVNKAKESARHNKTMEAIALSKKAGSALYLKPYKKGAALYLKPYPSGGKGLSVRRQRRRSPRNHSKN